jgi:GTPase SAR1 family protein
MSEFVHQLKLLTIGDSGVGKTWLLMRWAGAANLIDKRSRSLPTIGVDFKMKTVSIDGRRVKIQVVRDKSDINSGHLILLTISEPLSSGTPRDKSASAP